MKNIVPVEWIRRIRKGMVINMANKGTLSKNYYIVPETVANLGVEIYNMMAEADQAVAEASEIIADIASLTERVPSHIRCSELLEACASTQAEIKSVDFLSYGQKVDQGLQNLLDHNQYITEQFVKKMGTHTEKMRGMGEEFKRLTDTITYSGEGTQSKGIAFSAVSNAEDKDTDDRANNRYNENLESGIDVLKVYLEANNIINPVEKQTIINFISREQPQMLINLYITDCYSTADARVIFDMIMNYYKDNIDVKNVIEEFRKTVTDWDFISYTTDTVYTYMDYLKKLHVITPEECYRFTHSLIGIDEVTYDEFNEIYIFLLERMELIDTLKAAGWDRYQVYCALIIEETLLGMKYNEEYISGFIGNMYAESVCGIFESGKYITNVPPDYIRHVNECINYYPNYSNKNITDFDLMQVYDVMFLKCDDSNHSFGVGAFQWTFDRNRPLVELYLEEMGYSIDSDEFENKLQDYYNNRNSIGYEGVFISEEEVQRAEMRWLVQELNGKYNNVYEEYCARLTGNETVEDNINIATLVIKELYEQNRDNSDNQKRQNAANAWYNARYGN